MTKMDKITLQDTQKNELYCGDCIEVMKGFEDDSIDAVITDPPYELGFMGKSWDDTGIANNIEIWKECLRVLKPGGYLLSFGGTRTYHRMACAIEDAGFEIRDMIEWIYGSGFPKSFNIAKAIEGTILNGNSNTTEFRKIKGETKRIVSGYTKMEHEQGNKPANYNDRNGKSVIKPEFETSEAKQWEGWGTALKPAHEPICMARKPLSEKTVAKNVLKHGTGGINIDESRVEGDMSGHKRKDHLSKSNSVGYGSDNWQKKGIPHQQGRFPANLIHDNSEEVRACFPDTKDTHKNEIRKFINKERGDGFLDGLTKEGENVARKSITDSGNASRYFKSIIYQAKASKKERNAGLDGFEKKVTASAEFRPNHLEKSKKGEDGNPYGRWSPTKNNHPTVKPIKLIEYLVNMVSRKDATILDPFMGSGTTGIAAKNLNRNFIGIEKEAEYFKIA